MKKRTLNNLVDLMVLPAVGILTVLATGSIYLGVVAAGCIALYGWWCGHVEP
jgi:hypothetical protein